MTNSLKMARLDFYTMKSQLASYAVIIWLVLLFGFMGSSVTLICINCAWFVALMSTTIFAAQEKNNLNRLYGSLSLKLKDIVLGRYLFTVMSFVLSSLFAIALFFVFTRFGGQPFTLNDVFFSLGLSFLIFSAIVGMQMPIFFKLGYIKARVWMMIPFAAVIGLVVLPALVEELSGIIAFMISNQMILTLCCILASCVIQFLSYKIAVAAYRKGKRG